MTIASPDTPQMRQWKGGFGREYTDRNAIARKQLDDLYTNNYGITRRQLNERFLQDIPRSARILEVGCNVGNQLLVLQQMGYSDLYGIEIQSYALDLARSRTRNINLVQATAFDVPYQDQFFDLVFTSGVLIHIAPSDLPPVLTEIHRCAGMYIWGFEYYAPKLTPVNYRRHDSLLWKMDYAKSYLERFKDVELVREQRVRYLQNSNVDSMFLLRRKV